MAGYTGSNCETNIDDCAGLPCLNNASCIDLVNSYRCDCSGTGFEGFNCQVNINECLGNPCMNNARCNDTLGDYSCICPGSYCGKDCQRTDPCQTVSNFNNVSSRFTGSFTKIGFEYKAGIYKVPYSLFYGKFIKSVGEEYQV